MLGFPSPCCNRWIQAGPAALVAAALAVPTLYAQPPQDAPKLSFEVASVKEWGPGQGPSGTFMAGLQVTTGRIRSQCANLESLVNYAYQINGSKKLEGLPKWGGASCGYPDSAETFVID